MGRERKDVIFKGKKTQNISDWPAELNYSSSGCLVSIRVHFCPALLGWILLHSTHAWVNFSLSLDLQSYCSFFKKSIFVKLYFFPQRKAFCLRWKHNERPVMWKPKRNCLFFMCSQFFSYSYLITTLGKPSALSLTSFKSAENTEYMSPRQPFTTTLAIS